MTAAVRCPSWCVREVPAPGFVTHMSEPVVRSMSCDRNVSGWVELLDEDGSSAYPPYVQIDSDDFTPAGSNSIEDLSLEDAEILRDLLDELITLGGTK